MKKLRTTLVGITCLFSFGYSTAQTSINTTGSYIWNSADLPRTFNGKLQFSFVRSNEGFPNYGTVLAGGGYSSAQDGSAFQIYFPYSTTLGGKVPRIRMGLYNNLGWSDWQSFYTSANANNIDSDWTARKVYVVDKIGIGVQNPTEKLAVNGKIRATEIKVDAGPWPDYVFEETYQLPSLKETEAFVKLNKHLPGVPTAKEIEEDGLSLGEMNRIMMQKIEELTLYLIEKDKEITNIKNELQNLKNNTNGKM